MSRQVHYTNPKTPHQIVTIQDDFSTVLNIGETITAVSVFITRRETGVDVTAAMLVAGSITFQPTGLVTFGVKAGDNNTEYIIVIHATTSQARDEDSFVILPVFNRPLGG